LWILDAIACAYTEIEKLEGKRGTEAWTLLDTQKWGKRLELPTKGEIRSKTQAVSM
jgi:hypothetical protein